MDNITGIVLSIEWLTQAARDKATTLLDPNDYQGGVTNCIGWWNTLLVLPYHRVDLCNKIRSLSPEAPEYMQMKIQKAYQDGRLLLPARRGTCLTYGELESFLRKRGFEAVLAEPENEYELSTLEEFLTSSCPELKIHGYTGG